MKVFLYGEKGKNNYFFTVAENKKELKENGLDNSYFTSDISNLNIHDLKFHIETTLVKNIKIVFSDEYNTILEYSNNIEKYRICVNNNKCDTINYIMNIVP